MFSRSITRCATTASRRTGFASIGSRRHFALPTGTSSELLATRATAAAEAIVSVGPKETLLAAAKVMTNARMGAVIVSDESGCVGIISERDYLRAGARGQDPNKVLVQDVMTPRAKMHAVSSKDSIGKIMNLMNKYHVRHLPVLDDDKVAGLLTIRDVVNKVVQQSEDEVKRMQDFVAGTY